MDDTLYHLLLEGRQVGPYDKRTIVGMRQKNTLADGSVLIGPDGRKLTVEELIRGPRDEFALTGTFSLIKARFDAKLASSDRHGPLPRYEGDLEVRVQEDILRVAGKDDRVKIALKDVVHARARDQFADLWLRTDDGKLQAASFEMASPQAASELVKWLSGATPPTTAVLAEKGAPMPYGIVIGVAGAVIAIVLVVIVLFGARVR
ncbi:hypothetical protein [Ramlibacter sp. PS4R-6]|uniref:hypothetical protein n=1 Tax=Ramlibacter sp. PS4R-6 TaxID=3133438 RepID=UPI0030ADCF21